MVATSNPVEPLLLTAKQAAEYLALSESSHYRATRAGDLPCVNLGRLVRYNLAEIRAWIQSRRTAVLAK